MTPNYDNLYAMGENFAPFRGALRAGLLDDIDDCGALLRGDVLPRKAVRFGRRQGSLVRDVIWSTSVLHVLVSEKFRRVLETHGFTGWSTYPVAVYDREGQLIPGYAGLAVTGRAGMIDDDRSKRVWRGPAVEGGPKFQRYVGMFFEKDEWDGSDICLSGFGGYEIVTKRVKDALESADLDIANVQFDRLSEIERDVNRQLERRRKESR